MNKLKLSLLRTAREALSKALYHIAAALAPPGDQ